MGLEHKNEQTWFKLGTVIVLGVILIAFSITMLIIINIQNDKLDSLTEQLKARNFEFSINSSQSVDGNEVIDNSIILSNDEIAQNIDKDILIEMIKETKYYNETLNNYQSRTITTITYVVGFFAIIAMFFGYRTISDIKQNASDETNKLSSIYNYTFDILKTQAESNKTTQEFTHNKIKTAMDELDDKLKTTTETISTNMKMFKELTKEYEIMKTTIDKVRNDQDRKTEESNIESQKIIESLPRDKTPNENELITIENQTVEQENISILKKDRKPKE